MNNNWQWCQFLPQPKKTSLKSSPTRPWQKRLKTHVCGNRKNTAQIFRMCELHRISTWRQTTRQTRPGHDPFSVRPRWPRNSLHPPRLSWKSPYIWRHDLTWNPRERRTLHHTCLRLPKHQSTRTKTDQPPALRLRPKMSCSNHGPRHISDRQTTTTHLFSPLHKLWTNNSNRTEPEPRHMH